MPQAYQARLSPDVYYDPSNNSGESMSGRYRKAEKEWEKKLKKNPKKYFQSLTDFLNVFNIKYNSNHKKSINEIENIIANAAQKNSTNNNRVPLFFLNKTPPKTVRYILNKQTKGKFETMTVKNKLKTYQHFVNSPEWPKLVHNAGFHNIPTLLRWKPGGVSWGFRRNTLKPMSKPVTKVSNKSRSKPVTKGSSKSKSKSVKVSSKSKSKSVKVSSKSKSKSVKVSSKSRKLPRNSRSAGG